MKVLRKLIVLLLALSMLSALTAFAHPFEDVDAGAWYAPYVEYVCQRGLMNGICTDSFGPDRPMNRAMVVTVLYRMAGAPEHRSGAMPFADTERGAFYEKPVAWAYENGIAKGVSDSEFGSDAEVLRSQMVTFLYRYAMAAGHDTSARADLSGYRDCAEIPAFAADAFSWAVAEGIICGVGNDTLAPNGTANRAQCAAILMRADQLLNGTSEEETPVTLDLNPKKLDLYVGETYQMEITYDGTGTLVWESMVPEIISVTQTGEITALTAGTGYITVTDGAKRAAAKIIVSELPVLTVDVTETTIYVGSTYQVEYTYTGDPAALSWHSRNESAATVDQNGLVTALAKGNAFIVVTDGFTTKQCKIKIIEAPIVAEEIEVFDTNGPFYDGMTKYLGDYLMFETRVEPYNADQTVTVTTSDSDIVSISGRIVGSGSVEITLNFNAVGTAVITLTSGDGAVTQTYTITVTDTYEFDPGDRDLTPQEFADLTTKVMCANGFTYDRNSSWRTLFRIEKNELNYDRAVRLGLDLAHEWWSDGTNNCAILYLGQDYNGNYVFYKCK